MPTILYFDCETVPDYSRTDLFTPKLSRDARDRIDEAGQGGDPEWAKEIEATETSRVLSTQAEYCTLVGFNFALDEDEPRSGWVGDTDANGESITERSLLEAFWS